MIKMTNLNENTKSKEQNKKIKMVPDEFYGQLKAILEQDEFDLFKTKSKNRLESKLKISDAKIQKLLNLKIRSSEAIKKLSEQKKNLKSKNQSLKESIIKQLDLEVA